MARKGTPLDLPSQDAYRLLNDPHHCFAVQGKKQFVAVKDSKIYVFQPDGAGAYHAYPVTGQEITKSYPSATSRVASMLGTSVKRLSRMK